MKKKAILHNSLASLSNFAFTAITSIVLLPYYFKFIDKEMYGIWLGGISFLMLFSVFDANIALILTQKLGQHWIRQEKVKFAKFLFAALFLGVVFTFFITIFRQTMLNNKRNNGSKAFLVVVKIDHLRFL